MQSQLFAYCLFLGRESPSLFECIASWTATPTAEVIKVKSSKCVDVHYSSLLSDDDDDDEAASTCAVILASVGVN